MTKKFNSTILNNSCPYALPEELVYARKLMDKLGQDSRAMMIGAGPGVFALAMLEGRKFHPWLYVVEINGFQYFDAHLSAGGVDMEKIVHVHGDSALKAKEFLHESFDLILVDGDHSYEGVSRDIEAWWEKLAPGGFLFFHDYLERDGGFDGAGDWQEGGTARAIADHLTDEWKLLKKVGISVVYKKVKPK